ncbi:unnamed protein product, partial [Mesorhabditis belari]|uniref:Nucleolar protein 10 n=1 Tax=Mesorhabditis belari TaxID=2138241 RepID=A0AAF3F3P1_9BILA
MLLRYFIDENGRRVYTLKKTAPEGSQTFSAHPAKFSPEDKCSKYRVIQKLSINFSDDNILGMASNFSTKTSFFFSTTKQNFLSTSGGLSVDSSYHLCSFFVGWKVFGYTLTEMGLYVYDEETGKGHYRTPAEARELRNKLELEHERRLKKPIDVKSFPLDA